MSFDAALWTQTVDEKRVPSWPCPNCMKALVLVGTIEFHEQASSAAARSHEDWDPDWTDELFRGQAACIECQDRVQFWGKSSFEQDYDPDDGNLVWSRVTTLKGILPAPPMLAIPSECPPSVRQELEKSFVLYWIDPSSALGRIRTALERLCDEAGVPHNQFVVPKNSTKKELRRRNLHNRIEMLPTRYDRVRNHLLALKWLGNDGTHSDGPEARQDMLDALKVLDEVLRVLFAPEDEDANTIVRAVNKRKGSRNRKKR